MIAPGRLPAGDRPPAPGIPAGSLAKPMLLALKIEQNLSKDQILDRAGRLLAWWVPVKPEEVQSLMRDPEAQDTLRFMLAVGKQLRKGWGASK